MCTYISSLFVENVNQRGHGVRQTQNSQNGKIKLKNTEPESEMYMYFEDRQIATHIDQCL